MYFSSVSLIRSKITKSPKLNASVNDNVKKFSTGVKDTASKLFTGVKDNANKLFTYAFDTGKKTLLPITAYL